MGGAALPTDQCASATPGLEGSADGQLPGFPEELSRQLFDALIVAVLGRMNSLDLQYFYEVPGGDADDLPGVSHTRRQRAGPMCHTAVRC